MAFEMIFAICLSLLFLIPQSHGIVQDACDSRMNELYTGAVNASDNQPVQPQLRPPTGPLPRGESQWTWELAIESVNNGTVPGTALWLKSDPPQDFIAEDLNYLGCGLVLEGLDHDALVAAQNDDGTCGSILDDDCKLAIRKVAGTSYFDDQVLMSYPGTIFGLCAPFQNMAKDGNPGLPQECMSNFTKDAAVSVFPFASPRLSDILDKACWTHSQAGNASAPIWYQQADPYSPNNMTSYDVLATTTLPIVTLLFANTSAGEAPWFDSRFTCLTPSRFSAGSAHPSAVPESANGAAELRASTRMFSVWWYGVCCVVLVWLGRDSGRRG